jgi:hypothetical protein
LPHACAAATGKHKPLRATASNIVLIADHHRVALCCRKG